MTGPVDEETWRNRFILINLTRIGGTVVTLVGLFLWHSDWLRPRGDLVIGLSLALIGLVVSFGGPIYLSRRWREPPLPVKRFYKEAQIRTMEGATEVLLDGRPVKTPARNQLAVPSEVLGRAIADEWNGQGETIDPRSMPLTGLANAAIDRVAPDPATFARGLAAYGEADLLCYRANGPSGLVARQRDLWDPLLAWARHRFDVDFEVVSGIMHRPQPEWTVQQLGKALAARDPFELVAFSPLVTISGSLIIALALAEGAIDLDTAWAAASVDETWQAEQWGADAEAARVLEARRLEAASAYRFLELVRLR